MSRRLMDVADLPDYSGHPNSPHADDWDADDQQTMTAAELFDLAGKGDEAALTVMANEVEFDGTVDGIYAASDEEIGEWYAGARDEVSA